MSLNRVSAGCSPSVLDIEALVLQRELAKQLARLPHHRQAFVLASPASQEAAALNATTILALEAKGVHL